MSSVNRQAKFASPEERDEFILSHGRLGSYVANKKQFVVGLRGLDREDLLQAAWLGIVRCSDYYDRDRPKANFQRYAYPGVEREVLYAVVDQVAEVIVPDYPFRDQSKIARSKETSEAVEAAKTKTCTSLEFQPPGRERTPEEIAIRREHAKLLMDALGKLPKRERQVVMAVYGIGCDPMMQADIARLMKLTRSRVGQIKDKGIEKLRKALGQIGDDL